MQSNSAVRYKNGLLCDGSIKPNIESERKVYHEIKYMKSQHKTYHYRMTQKNYSHPATHIPTKSASYFVQKNECTRTYELQVLC